MNKLLILSTLLFCLTASNKTFSAQIEKQYRLVQLFRTTYKPSDDNGNGIEKQECSIYLTAESDISNDEITNYRNSLNLYYTKHWFHNGSTGFSSETSSQISFDKSSLFSKEKALEILASLTPKDSLTNSFTLLQKNGNAISDNTIQYQPKQPDPKATELTVSHIDNSNSDSDDSDASVVFVVNGADNQDYVTPGYDDNYVTPDYDDDSQDYVTPGDDDDIDDAINKTAFKAVKNPIAQSKLLPKEGKKDNDDDDVRQLSSPQPISPVKEGLMGKASENGKVNISIAPNKKTSTIEMSSSSISTIEKPSNSSNINTIEMLSNNTSISTIETPSNSSNINTIEMSSNNTSISTIQKPSNNSNINTIEMSSSSISTIQSLDGNNKEKDGSNSYLIGSATILLGAAFLAVLKRSQLSNSSKKKHQ